MNSYSMQQPPSHQSFPPHHQLPQSQLGATAAQLPPSQPPTYPYYTRTTDQHPNGTGMPDMSSPNQLNRSIQLPPSHGRYPPSAVPFSSRDLSPSFFSPTAPPTGGIAISAALPSPPQLQRRDLSAISITDPLHAPPSASDINALDPLQMYSNPTPLHSHPHPDIYDGGLGRMESAASGFSLLSEDANHGGLVVMHEPGVVSVGGGGGLGAREFSANSEMFPVMTPAPVGSVTPITSSPPIVASMQPSPTNPSLMQPQQQVGHQPSSSPPTGMGVAPIGSNAPTSWNPNPTPMMSHMHPSNSPPMQLPPQQPPYMLQPPPPHQYRPPHHQHPHQHTHSQHTHHGQQQIQAQQQKIQQLQFQQQMLQQQLMQQHQQHHPQAPHMQQQHPPHPHHQQPMHQQYGTPPTNMPASHYPTPVSPNTMPPPPATLPVKPLGPAGSAAIRSSSLTRNSNNANPGSTVSTPSSPMSTKRKRAPSAIATAAKESELLREASGSPIHTPGGSIKRKFGATAGSNTGSMPGTASSRSRSATRGKMNNDVRSTKQEADDDAAGTSASGTRGDEDETNNVDGISDEDEDDEDENDDGDDQDGTGQSNSEADNSHPHSGTSTPRPSSSRAPARKIQSRRNMDEATLKRLRLDRKAELARLSRRQKKDRLTELETENSELRNKIEKLTKSLRVADQVLVQANLGTVAEIEKKGGVKAAFQHKDKKLKSEPNTANSSMTSPSEPNSGNKHQASAPIRISPLATSEQLLKDLDHCTMQLIHILQGPQPSTSPSSSSPSPSPTNAHPSSNADASSNIITTPAMEQELSVILTRLLELHNSKCLLNAEMSHAYESMLYLDGRNNNTNGGSNGGVASNPGLLPTQFFHWLLRQPTSFYTDTQGLWHSIWSVECGLNVQQIAHILDMKLSRQFEARVLTLAEFDAQKQQQNNASKSITTGSVPSPISGNSMPSTTSGSSAASGPNNTSGVAMSDGIVNTPGSASSSASSISGTASATATAAAGAVSSTSNVTGPSSLYTNMLTSFEHFRSLLMNHQQEELSILSQLMQILNPVQFAKFTKFAVTIGPIVMNLPGSQQTQRRF